MTLKQAFTIWAYSPGNTVLAAKSREAVQRVLMKKWNDIGLEQFTEQFCRRIFYQSTESLELKVKAASILVYVLQWGSDNGHCQRPTFTLAIAREEHERAEKDKGQQAEGIVLPTLDEMKGESVYMPADEPTVRVKPEALFRRKAELKARKPDVCDGCNNVKGCITCVNGDQWARIMEAETKTKKNMDEKKTRGKQARKICQIDAETLQVIKTYDSCSEGCRAAGVKNIDRAIKRLQLAGGYYWQYPEDVATFADRLAAKRAASKPVKHKPSPSTGDAHHRGQSPCNSSATTHTGDSPHDSLSDDAPNVTNDNQRGTAAHEALEVFTDDELLEELDRRGWQGELRKVQIVTIGTK